MTTSSDLRRCSDCQCMFPTSAFYADAQALRGMSRRCRRCDGKRTAARQRVRKHIHQGPLPAMPDECQACGAQEAARCGRPLRLHIDYDRAAAAVAWCCSKCLCALGIKSTAADLRQLADYVERVADGRPTLST